MNVDTLAEISQMVELLTTSGQPYPDEKLLKQLKAIVKQSEEYVEHCFRQLRAQLQKNHSEIRLAALKLINEFFVRSHHFRELLLGDFDHFLDETLGNNLCSPLPPPKFAAKQLKETAMKYMQAWQTDYGETYKVLKIGLNYLKHGRKIQVFEETVVTEAERRRNLECLQRLQHQENTRVEKALEQLQGVEKEVSVIIVQIRNCLDILLTKMPDGSDDSWSQCSTHDAKDDPPCETSDWPGSATNVERVATEPSREDSHPTNHAGAESDSDEEYEPYGAELRQHGFTQQQAAVSVDVLPGRNLDVPQTEDNEIIVSTIQDLVRELVKNYRSQIDCALVTFTKAGKQQLIRRALDSKTAISEVMEQVQKLHFIHKRYNVHCDDTDDDDDLEDVPDFIEKEGYEASVKHPACTSSVTQPRPSTSKDWSLQGKHKNSDAVKDPTTWEANVARLPGSAAACCSAGFSTSEAGPKVENARREALLRKAPVVPFNTDLFYWEEDIEPPLLVRNESEHRFWNPKDIEDTVDKTAVAAMTSRMIEFTGDFKPVEHQCLAPLANGRLCPRKDRVKCPFHGPIIPRDAVGQPLNPSVKVTATAGEGAVPDWEEPELQEEIKAATGIDVSRPKKVHGKVKRKYPNLTDINKKRNNPRSRLERKIFNRSTIKSICEELDLIDAKRFKDKFANQFQYLCNKY